VQIKRLRRASASHANGCAVQIKWLRRANQTAAPRKTASPSKCFDKQTTLRHK